MKEIAFNYFYYFSDNRKENTQRKITSRTFSEWYRVRYTHNIKFQNWVVTSNNDLLYCPLWNSARESIWVEIDIDSASYRIHNDRLLEKDWISHIMTKDPEMMNGFPRAYWCALARSDHQEIRQLVRLP